MSKSTVNSGWKRSLLAAVFGLVLAFSSAPELAAQSYAGAAGIGLEVKDRDGKPLAGATITASYVELDPAVGPPPVETDAQGQAVLIRLAAGRWRIDVTAPDHSPYLVVVRLEADKKPQITAGPIRDAVAPPLKVKLEKVKFEVSAPGFAPEPQTKRDKARAKEEKRKDRRGRRGRDTDRRPPPPPPVSDFEPTTKIEPPPPPAPVPTPLPPTPPQPAPVSPPPKAEPPKTEPPVPALPPEPPLPEPPSQVPEPAVETQPTQPAQPPVQPPEPPRVIPPPPEPAIETPPTPPQPVPQPAVPQPEPATPPVEPPPAPPVPPAPAPAPPTPPVTTIRSEVRSFTDPACPGCKSGEWALTMEQTAASGRRRDACPADPDDLKAAFQALLDGAEGQLDSYTGPAVDPDSGQLVPIASDADRARVAELLGPGTDPDSGCQVMAVILPRGARFSGYRYEARDNNTGRDCLAGEDCPVGACRWPEHPQVVKSANGTIVFSGFKNWSGQERTALLIVYFSPPRR